MSDKNKKQFGIWMDANRATIVGREKIGTGDFIVLVQKKNAQSQGNSNDKFFQQIAAHMQNIDEVHVTGTGQVQEQFIRFLAATPPFKNVVANHSTTNKMSEESLLAFISARFNETV